MKATITKSDFTTAFHNAGRGNQFSHNGLCELYDFLVELENDTDSEFELDVIALCCDFTESDIDEIANDCGIDLSDCIYLEGQFNAVIDYLESKTAVIYSDELTGTVLYQNF